MLYHKRQSSRLAGGHTLQHTLLQISILPYNPRRISVPVVCGIGKRDTLNPIGQVRGSHAEPHKARQHGPYSAKQVTIDNTLQHPLRKPSTTSLRIIMPTTEEIIQQDRTDPVKHLLTDATTPTEISTLLRCAVEVMNFEVLQYLLTTFKPDNGEWNFDQGIVREALSPGKANAFKLLCEFNSSILTTQLDHHGDPLAYAILG